MAEKKPHGRPRNTPIVDPADIPLAAMASKGRVELSKATGISDKDAEIIKKVTGMTAEQYQDKIWDKMRELVDESLDLLRPKLPELSGPQLAVNIGILADKLDKAPKSITNNLHIHMKEGDRLGVLGALLGKHNERVCSQPDNMTKELKKEPGPLVLDAESAPILQSGDSECPDKQRK